MPGSTYLSLLRARGKKNVAIRYVQVLEPSQDFKQMAALEATVSKRVGFWTMFYLVLMFFGFGFGLGELKL